MERISSFFLMGYAQRSRTSFFNTCMKNIFLFWPINVEISFNTKTRLVFALMLISIFIGQNKCWRRMFCFSVHCPWEKDLKSFPFKVILSWKQCSCDVIIARVYCSIIVNYRFALCSVHCICVNFNHLKSVEQFSGTLLGLKMKRDLCLNLRSVEMTKL
jgi:hypothetical protein